MNGYASCQDELIMFSYLCGTVYVASYCVFSGELISGFMFLHEKVRAEVGWMPMHRSSSSRICGRLLASLGTSPCQVVALKEPGGYTTRWFTPLSIFVFLLVELSCYTEGVGKSVLMLDSPRQKPPSRALERLVQTLMELLPDASTFIVGDHPPIGQRLFTLSTATIVVVPPCTCINLCFMLSLFRLRQGPHALVAVMLYCGAGFLGGSCAVALTKRFGALHSAITTTARKAVTLMLSFAYFQKAFTPQHLVGATVFMVGLMVSSATRCTFALRTMSYRSDGTVCELLSKTFLAGPV